MATFAVDLHTHTRFFHGSPSLGRRFDPIGARMALAAARARNLDAIATTNHDYYRDFDLDWGPTVIPGIEVTTSAGHLLVVGPDPPSSTEPGHLTPGEAVDLAHDRGCAAIVAHPYRNSTVSEADAAFDAVEVNGKGLDHEPVLRLAERLGLPLVGGSDAHYPFEVGRAFTRVEADELTPESLVGAIREGHVAPTVSRSPLQRLLRSAYTAVHARKGWLDRPTPPGLGAPPGEDDGGSSSTGPRAR